MKKSSSISKNPWELFDFWYKKNLAVKQKNPNWMMLSTSFNGLVDARVVLLKYYSAKLGFVFFTNYNSLKSRSIKANSNVSLVFFWDFLQVQIRINGHAKKSSRKLSQEYFASRPLKSQIGAWASSQSEVLETRSQLEKNFSYFEKKFAKTKVPCPKHWGGWHVMPFKFEFWKGIEGRLHERTVYQYSKNTKTWRSHLLYP